MDSRFLLILLSTLLAGCAVNSKQGIKNVEEINNYIKLIDTENLQKITIPFDGEYEYKEADAIRVVNVGDSKITVYYGDNLLLRLDVFYNGSHGDLTTIIYVKKERPVYIRKLFEGYDPPKYEEGSKIWTEILDEYYISGDEIIFFKNNGKVISCNQLEEFNIEMKFDELYKDFKNYVRIVSEYNSD